MELLLNNIWPHDSTFGQSIVLVILFLLMGSVLAGLYHWWRYTRENTNLNKVRSRLKQEREGMEIVDANSKSESDEPTVEDNESGESSAKDSRSNESTVTATASDDISSGLHGTLVDIDALKSGVDPFSLIYGRLNSIARMRHYHVKVNISTLQQHTLAREAAQRGLALPAFTAGAAMMLGILGTFWGLATVVQDIYIKLPDGLQELNTNSWLQSIQNIRVVLNGMKTAFSTSLAGMGCAVIAAMINYGLRRRQARFLERLELFTSDELLPATVPVVEDETLLEQVSRQLEESSVRLEQVFSKNETALSELNGIQTSFQLIVDNIRSITSHQGAGNLEKVIDSLVQANQAMLAIGEDLPKFVSAVEQSNLTLGQNLQKLGRERTPQRLVRAAPLVKSFFHLMRSKLFANSRRRNVLVVIIALMAIIGTIKLLLETHG
jgi:hypothetical protein